MNDLETLPPDELGNLRVDVVVVGFNEYDDVAVLKPEEGAQSQLQLVTACGHHL